MLHQIKFALLSILALTAQHATAKDSEEIVAKCDCLGGPQKAPTNDFDLAINVCSLNSGPDCNQKYECEASCDINNKWANCALYAHYIVYNAAIMDCNLETQLSAALQQCSVVQKTADAACGVYVNNILVASYSYSATGLNIH